MATFACFCGTGTTTGAAGPNPNPLLTFTCDNHGGGGSRVLAEMQVIGSPADAEALMSSLEQTILDNQAWLEANPAPAKLANSLIVGG